MTRIDRLVPRFVGAMPLSIDEGLLYISTLYATTLHLCACGCLNKVVLPLSRAEWQLTWDGETVSMSPSIGNWEYPCQSHYWIERSSIRWAEPWSRAHIEAGRRRDATVMAAMFEATPGIGSSSSTESAQEPRLAKLLRRWLRR